MLAELRKSHILREVDLRGTVKTSDLVEILGVSDMTVRRDLAELDRQGLLIKVHGGATSLRSTIEPAYAEKKSLNAEAKSAIARAAVARLAPGGSVAFSAGTTCTAVAELATNVPNLTVVTNSLRVADAFFAAGSSSSVLLTGGTRTPSDALVGPLATRSLEDLHVDTLILGAHGAGLDTGLTTPNLSEARVNRALIAAARKVVAVFDHSKWGVTGLAGFAHWDEIDVVITDTGLDEQIVTQLEDIVDEVVVVAS